MLRSIYLRARLRCCAVACAAFALPPVVAAQTPAPTGPASSASQSATAEDSHASESAPSGHQRREAENAYLAGAKKLEHDDLDAAEREFQRALQLDPKNPSYTMAISVAREHRLMELVQQASKARQAGDTGRADTLLAAARALDPSSPLVLEHSQPLAEARAAQALAPGIPIPPLADRTRMLNGPEDNPWKIEAPVLAGGIQLNPQPGPKDVSAHGSSGEVIRDIASAYGIHAVVDDSVERKDIRFDLQNVDYRQAMDTLMTMTRSFAVPLDATSILVAKSDPANRDRLQRLMEEKIDVPGATADQLSELSQIIQNIFDIKRLALQTNAGSLIVRAPEDLLPALNETIQGLIEGPGEVLLDVKMYEIDTTHMTNAGAALPSQFTVFNVEQAANTIVNANQTLVQQAIAQGYITSSTSNLDIALALINLGLVQSSLASNLIGILGGGLTQTGISASSSTTFNLALNSGDSRTLDQVQLRVRDHETGNIREGTRYPITSSTYSSGIPAAASALGNTTINGVNVGNLLKQYAGGAAATVPQITYEDLGLTLNVTPTIERAGRVYLDLELKIEALGSGSANGIPVLNNRSFKSKIMLAEGESALMASLVSKTETAALTGIPGLSELPGFQVPTEKNVEHDTTQLVLMITPHVVRQRINRSAGPRLALHLTPAAD